MHTLYHSILTLKAKGRKKPNQTKRKENVIAKREHSWKDFISQSCMLGPVSEEAAVKGKYSAELHSQGGFSNSSSSFLRLFMHKTFRPSLKDSIHVSIKDYKGMNSSQALKSLDELLPAVPTCRQSYCHLIPKLFLLLLALQ